MIQRAPIQMRLNGIAVCRLRTGEIGVDLFAGGGGFSEGYRRAVGISPTEAVNHCQHAIEMHRANHPDSRHHRECVWKAEPREIVQGRPVGHLHASPDCTYHSQARGGKPMRDRYIRALPWAVVRWMKETRSRIVTMENVKEFRNWGPLILKRNKRGRPLLDKKGKKQWVPDKKRRAETYREFIAAMEALGYTVETKLLLAADYGSPTRRLRWYLIARCDGEAIQWPEPTHGPGRAHPYRTTAENIDFDIPMASIFLTRAEAKAWKKATGQAIKRPLAAKTMARIAEGVRRYVVQAAEDEQAGRGPGPFLVRLGQYGGNGSYTSDPAAPLSTITTKAEHLLVSPSLVQVAHGDFTERTGGRTKDVRQPLGTVCKNNNHALVTAFLAKHNGKTVGQEMAEPIDTVTGRDTKALVACSLTRFYGTGVGSDARTPLPTVTADGQHFGIVAAHLTKFRENSVGSSLGDPCPTITSGAGSKRPAGAAHALGIVAAHLTKAHGHGWDKQAGRSLEEPLGTIVGKNEDVLVAAHITKMNQNGVGQDPREPLATVMAGASRFGVVAAFMQKYYGRGIGTRIDEPTDTITSKDHLSLVTVLINGETWAIADICMRMLTPRELARCQGFDDSYILTGTNAEQVARIGNSVCPQVAEAIVAANLDPAAPAQPARRRKGRAA